MQPPSLVVKPSVPSLPPEQGEEESTQGAAEPPTLGLAQTHLSASATLVASPGLHFLCKALDLLHLGVWNAPASWVWLA